MTDPVAAAVAAREHELVAFRRRMHAHPELSTRETATTQAIAERLAVAGLQPRVLVGGTGLVCDLPGGPGPMIALRADIDALAMEDRTEADYRSRVPGVAHACGHDVHTAITLGAGLVLRALSAESALPGPVRLIFEPAEETMPGGAVEIIDEGWLEEPAMLFGLHCDPKLDVGQIGLRVGPLTAAADVVEIVVEGPGGHTARPQLTVDLVRVMSGVLCELPDRVTKELGNADDVVVVFGSVQSGDAANVIPSRAVARGSVRTAEREAWDRAEEVTRGAIAEMLGGSGAMWQVHYRRGVPPVVNDAAAVEVMSRAAHRVVGAAGAVDTPRSMGGDSFAWYGEHVAAAYARLGTHSGDRPRLDLHASTFDVDESCIAVGVRFLVACVTEAWMDLGAAT